MNYNPFISSVNIKKEKINENSSFSFLTSNDKLNSNKNENEMNNDTYNLEIKKIKRSNSKNGFTEIAKCLHKKFFTSYCTKDSNNIHGFFML